MFNKSASTTTPSPSRDDDPGLDIAPPSTGIRPSGSTPSTAPAAPRGPRAASLISSDMRIEGTVQCEGELQIDGIVKGDVRVSRLTIGEQGQVEGSVMAESVDCRGRVTGSISAKQVRLHTQAHIEGDISHEQLAMEGGAFFQGRSLRLKRDPAKPQISAPAPSASSSSSNPASSPTKENGATATAS